MFRGNHRPDRKRLKPGTARTIADALTWARVISVVPITVLAVYQLRWWVFGLYIAASLTDLLDGRFARRAGPPATDLDFDGLADLLFTVMTVFWLWLLMPGFLAKYALPYLPLFVLLEAYMTVARVRHPRLAVPHLRFGRFAMALFFSLLPVLLLWGDVSVFVHAVLIIGIASKAQLALAMARRAAAAGG